MRTHRPRTKSKQSRKYDMLTMDESMAGLPVTDLRHVIKEINLQRRTLLVLDYQRKYSRACTAKYNNKRKK